jgi:hypothetical protein
LETYLRLSGLYEPARFAKQSQLSVGQQTDVGSSFPGRS